MELKNTMTHNYGGFTLDTDMIGNTSTSKDEIKLPYMGRLPAPCDTATINFKVAPGRCDIVLETVSGKSNKYIVLASRDEVDKILWQFFFEPYGKNERTRFNCGLSEYWLGYYQGLFISWRKNR